MSRISYSATTIFGKMTAETINTMLQNTATLARLKSTIEDAVGSPPDWTQIESGDFGVSTGNGQLFYNTVVSLSEAMSAISPSTINSLDMGG